MEGARAAVGAEALTVGAEAAAVGAEAGGRWAKPGGRCSPEAAGGGEPRSPSPFPFPYRPYPIQERFMAALYAALQAGQVGIFESPTGTVRSRTGNGGGGGAGSRSRPGGAWGGRALSPRKCEARGPVSEVCQPHLWCWCTLRRCRGEAGTT